MASALANPAGPPPPYHPAPVHGGYKIPPRPFAYAYGVSDEYSGTNFDKKETQVNKSFLSKIQNRISEKTRRKIVLLSCKKFVKTQFLGVVEFPSILLIQFFKVVVFPSNF